MSSRSRASLDRLHEFWIHDRYLHLSPYHHYRKRLILKLLHGLKAKNCMALDVGCGIGEIIVELTKRGFGCLGLDLSEYALHKAKPRAASQDFLLCDARFLPVRSGSCDLVVCSELLEHIREDSDVLSEIARVLLPGGRSILTVPHWDKYWTHGDEMDGHLRRYSKPQFLSAIERAGFTAEKVICWGFPLAVLFRKFVSSPIFETGRHRSLLSVGESRIYGLFMRFLIELFRVDGMFSSLAYGLGLAARIRSRRVMAYAHPTSLARNLETSRE